MASDTSENSDHNRQTISQRVVPETIRSRYLVKFGIILVVMGVAVGSIGVVGTVWLTDEMEQNALNDQATLADLESSNLERWLDQHEGQTGRIAANTIVRSGDTDRIQSEFFDELLANIPLDVIDIHYLDTERGEIRASTNESLRGDSVTTLGLPDSQAVDNRSTQRVSYRTRPYVTGSDEIPVITYAREARGKPDRVILYSVPLRAFSSELRTYDDEQSVTLVVDDQRRVVMNDKELSSEQGGLDITYEPQPQLEPFDSLIFPDGARVNGPPEGQGMSRFEFENGEYIVGYTPVEGTDWTLLIYEPVDRELGFVQTVQLYGMAGSVLAILVITLLGGLLGRNTISAINRLTDRAEAIQREEFDIDLDTTRSDEIGTLYEAFAEMRETIQQRIDALETAKEREQEMRKELVRTSADLEDQRLITSVLNRLLRHNLRNSLTKILLWSESVADEVGGDSGQKVDRIYQEAERLRRQAEKLRAVERVFNTEPADLSIVDVTAAVDDAVDIYSSEYPEAAFQTEFESQSAVRSGEGLSFVVDNLVENAVEHNDKSNPRVWITVETTVQDGEEVVEIEISDNGPGIPAMEIHVLERGKETPLEHGSGIGLWLVNWLITHLNGTLDFESRDPRGTTVVVRLPTATQQDVSASDQSSELSAE